MFRHIVFLALTTAAVAADQPNVVVIIADDLGSEDTGAYGHPKVRTPNIDRLATTGMRFDRAFLTCSSCSPSRSSLLTGRYPHQTGAEQLHWPLPADQVMFTTPLREAGYWTAAAGKWHLGPDAKKQFDLVKEGGGKSHSCRVAALGIMKMGVTWGVGSVSHGAGGRRRVRGRAASVPMSP